MINRLKGKTALITGATAGIGEATARQLAGLGVNLIITGRRQERLEALAAQLTDNYQIEVTQAAFDISDRQACIDFVGSLGELTVDILVNNAGGALGVDPVDRADFADWDGMIDANVKGLLSMTRLLTPGMRERNSGHIVNIGSVAGHESYPGGAVYCATKHAVAAITRATKMDLHGTNIRVSMMSPGLVDTEFSTVRFHGDTERAGKVYQGMQPLLADDIAEVIVFVLNRPEHVDIMDTIVFPTAQSAATMVARDAD